MALPAAMAVNMTQLRQRPNKPLQLDTGLPLEQLPTPALVINKPALQRNIATMASYLGQHGKGFRPHAKTHKCPLIAALQLQAGAEGICVAKVSEAVVMVEAGIEPLLITSPITTAAKAEVVGALAQRTTQLQIVVDSLAGLAALEAALPTDAQLGILIDLDINMGRTGVRDDGLVLSLLERLAANPQLNFVGFQHYAGHVMHVQGYSERRDKSLALWAQVEERLASLAAAGVTPKVVTGCGTGTYNIDVEVDAVTDLQVGSYIFMDEEYRLIGGIGQERFEDFEVSLTVACTTISAPTAKTITVDGGYKALASDTVAPVCDDLPGVKFRFAGDEHGVLIKPEGEQSLQLGQLVQVVTPHCDPTVNLHDYYWMQEEDGLVHSAWPISARGCSW
ncbi:MAG: DSD1 family PLP-dependent enzyme [Pseudomonadota bacterium]